MADTPASWRALLRFLLLELPFVPLLAIGWSWLASIELDAVLVSLVVANLLRWLALVVQLSIMLRPLEHWQELEPQHLRDLAAELARFPRRLAIGHTSGWLCLYIGLSANVWIWRTDIPLGAPDLVAVAFFVTALGLGAIVFAYALGNMVITEPRAAIAGVLLERGLPLPLAQASLLPRVNAILINYVMTALLAIAACGWSNLAEFNRRDTISRLGMMALHDRHRVEQGLAPRHARMLETAALADSTSLVPSESFADELHAVLDRRLGRAQVEVALDDGRWLLVEGELSSTGVLGRLLMVIGLAVALWGTITSVIITRALIQPLVGLEATMRRLVDIGDIHRQGPLWVVRNDEIGVLTRCYNDLVRHFRSLAEAAREVARGQLNVTLTQRGDLHDAFRGMVEQLATIVQELRSTAVELASTTTQLDASTREQDRAAQRSSASVGEVRSTVVSLASSAANIAGMADDVRANAERSLATTEVVSHRIGELSAQTERINRLLEFIREIADRSDLLALNGALEATRAGEAGKGFALVSEEMRRLAERVTHTVADVHGLVREIELASVAAVAATTDSRALAQATAAAAQQIVTLTRRQSEDTTRAAAIADTMAELAVANSSATAQTRRATTSLHGRVELLQQVLARFEVRER